MAKNNMGDKLFGAFVKTVETVKTTTTEKIAPEVSKAAKKAADGIKEADIPGSIKKATQDLQDQAKAKSEQKKAEAEERRMAEEQKALEAPVILAISPANAVKVFYYLMAADGNIAEAEEEKFELIGNELDPKFEDHKESIVKVCKEQLDKVIDKADYYDTVQDGVEEALLVKQNLQDGFVTPKLLLWNLLTIAYSDDDYNEEERKIMKYIVRKLNIEKDVFLEMENSLLTISDLEKEINWIKTTDRQYTVIEAQVKEIEKRQQAIFESVKALIYL